RADAPDYSEPGVLFITRELDLVAYDYGFHHALRTCRRRYAPLLEITDERNQKSQSASGDARHACRFRGHRGIAAARVLPQRERHGVCRHRKDADAVLRQLVLRPRPDAGTVAPEGDR